MKVNIPQFYVAFVLKDQKSKPTREECEKLRLATVGHMLQKLKATYPGVNGLDLKFASTEHGSNKPEPRFQVFVEVVAAVSFSVAPTTKPQELFESVLCPFNRDYLLKVVRPLGGTFGSAVEVQAQRLKHPTVGGVVKAPACYAAFVCSKPPTKDLTQHEEDQLLQLTKKEATRQMKQAYGYDFEELSIKITKTETGANAGKPEAKFNLYVEFEAVATFAQNAPTPMELFSALSKCTNPEYLSGVMDIGGYLATITSMVFRVCVFIEYPVLLEEEGEGVVAGDAVIVKIHMEFFVALVVRCLEKMPPADQMEIYDNFMRDFFSAILARHYPSSFIDMAFMTGPKFGARLPLPRFNVLHEYKVTLQFYDPPPDGLEILTKIVQCNTSALFDGIKQLAAPWDNTSELTMGKAVEKPLTDDIFGGKIEEQQKVSPSPPQVADPPSKEEPPNVATPKVVKKGKEPKPAPPKPAPPVERVVSVHSFDIYTALMVRNEQFEPQASEPSDSDYRALVGATQDFFAGHLKANHTNFEGVNVSIRKRLWNSGTPSKWYNVHIQWDVEAKFLGKGEEDANVPDSWHLTQSLVLASCNKYHKKIRTLNGTPFALTTGVQMEQVKAK